MKALNHKAVRRARLKLLLFFLGLICTVIGSVYSYFYITIAEIDHLGQKVEQEMNEIYVEQSLLEKFDSVQLYFRLMDMQDHMQVPFFRRSVDEKILQIQEIIAINEHDNVTELANGIVTCIQQVLRVEDSLHTCLTAELQLRNAWINCISDKKELLNDNIR